MPLLNTGWTKSVVIRSFSQNWASRARVLLSKSGGQQKVENLLEEPQRGSKKVEMFRNWN